jgi:hypothetical protein
MTRHLVICRTVGENLYSQEALIKADMSGNKIRIPYYDLDTTCKLRTVSADQVWSILHIKEDKKGLLLTVRANTKGT